MVRITHILMMVRLLRTALYVVILLDSIQINFIHLEQVRNYLNIYTLVIPSLLWKIQPNRFTKIT